MFNILTFLKGFNIFNGEKLGKLLFYAIIIIIALTIYHKAFEPKTIIEKQVIEKQYNCPDENKVIGASINIWKLRLSLGL